MGNYVNKVKFLKKASDKLVQVLLIQERVTKK